MGWKLKALAGGAIAGLAALVLLAPWSGGAPPAGAKTLQPYGELPLFFVENRGQADERVRYHARGPDYAFSFTRDAVVMALHRGERRGVAVGLRFLGANSRAEIHGAEPTGATVNYLRGNDADDWQTGLPAYASVVYRDLWPGVDMVLRGDGTRLKYEFRLQPGARVSDIRLAYTGADGVAVDDSGALSVRTALGALRDSAPESFQVVDGERVPVESRYVLGERSHGFAVGDYREDRELIIDPAVEYATLLGGSSDEDGNGIAVDSAGNAYIVGTTQSSDLPATAGAFDRSFAGGVVDVYVAKLRADGSGLAYATYLGGTPAPLIRGTADPIEFGRGIAVDGDGHAYVTGQTTSPDFPTTAGAFDRSLNTSDRDATDGFLTKLDPTGSGLVYSTFLGGTSTDDPDAVRVDGAGNAYVAGRTVSTNFPVTAGAIQSTNAGGFDAFVAKFNASGSALTYSTLFGGADNEISHDVAVDSAGNAFVVGGTRSADFPTTSGAFDTTHNGGDFAALFDAFVAKVNPTGTALAYSTFLGGSDVDTANELAVDGNGSAHVVGATLSAEFPTTPGAFDTTRDGTSDAYVAKLDPQGSTLAYSTFLGEGSASSIVLDPDGGSWLAGGTSAPDAPVTPDAFQSTPAGQGDLYLAKLSADGSAIEFGSFYGGSDSDGASDIARDSAGNLYMSGNTLSSDFPTTAGAFDRTFGGDPSIFWGDAFVVKVSGAAGADPGDPAPPPAERTTSTFSGKIDKNQTRTHTVSVGAAGPVDLALDWNDSRVGLTLRARGPAGDVVFSDTSTAKPKQGTFTAAAAGDYRIEAVNTTDRNTDYSLTVTYPVASSEPAPEPAPAPAALSSVSLSPSSVEGGASSTGTVRLDGAAPAGGASVSLSSSNTSAATVPAGVVVPEGATSATFTLSTNPVSSDTSSLISATYDGVTRSATLAVTAPASGTDTVTITRAEYETDKRNLRVEATSSASGATLRVYETSTDSLIGTLSGGRGEFSWPRNPQSVTVRSSLGGEATRTVTAK